MPDDALKNAEAERDRLKSQISAAEQQIIEARAKLERVDRFIAEWYQFAGIPQTAVVEGKANVLDTSRATPRSRPKNPKKEEVAERAISILKTHGSPMPRADLLRALRERGVNLQGKDPEMVLSTMLWRMGNRIVRLAPHGYWPADLPYPPAGYEPKKTDPESLAKEDTDASKAPNSST